MRQDGKNPSRPGSSSPTKSPPSGVGRASVRQTCHRASAVTRKATQTDTWATPEPKCSPIPKSSSSLPHLGSGSGLGVLLYAAWRMFKPHKVVNETEV